MSKVVGYRADCRERFNAGEAVSVLCKAGDWPGWNYRAHLRAKAQESTSNPPHALGPQQQPHPHPEKQR
jgi:hypothetical protein